MKFIIVFKIKTPIGKWLVDSFVVNSEKEMRTAVQQIEDGGKESCQLITIVVKS